MTKALAARLASGCPPQQVMADGRIAERASHR